MVPLNAALLTQSTRLVTAKLQAETEGRRENLDKMGKSRHLECGFFLNTKYTKLKIQGLLSGIMVSEQFVVRNLGAVSYSLRFRHLVIVTMEENLKS